MTPSTPFSSQIPSRSLAALAFMDGTLRLGERGELHLTVVGGVICRARLDRFELRTPEVVRTLVQAMQGHWSVVCAGTDREGVEPALWLPLAAALVGPDAPGQPAPTTGTVHRPDARPVRRRRGPFTRLLRPNLAG